jgi:lipoprotein-anchoring transpeptidase ErfK/SrfK
MKSLMFSIALLCAAASPRLCKAGHLRPSDAAIQAAAIENSNQPLPIGAGAKGSAVVRAQILLNRAHFSCGEIDGDFGSNLQKTVAAFQRAHDLPIDGAVGPATWAALNQDQAPALITYTIASEDLAGPFVKLPPDLMEQAKLTYLGYESPLEELAEKYHSSPALLKALNPESGFDKQGESITVPSVIAAPPGRAASVEVSKSDSSVAALDSDGKVLSFYVATIGSEHDPLPIGTWKINGVAHNPVFHYDPSLFWNANATDQKAVIQAGPRNPVGVVWIDLSKEHYGIHGTPAPGKVGHAESHGCIRLTNWDATELAAMVKPGTPAILKE